MPLKSHPRGQIKIHNFRLFIYCGVQCACVWREENQFLINYLLQIFRNVRYNAMHERLIIPLEGTPKAIDFVQI